MSSNPVALPAIEWSPGSVRAFVPGQGIVSSVPSGWSGVRAALSRRNTFVRAIRIPNVAASEAQQIVRIQIPQHFPLPADDVVFAFRMTNDVNSEGRLVVVAAARADVVRQLRSDLKARDVSVQEVIPAAFGTVMLAREMGRADGAFLEHGPEGWSIDLVADGELRYSRVLPPEADPAMLEGEVARTYAMAGLKPASVVGAGGASVPFASATTEKSGLELLSSAGAGALGVELALPEVRAARERQIVSTRARLAVLLCVAAVGVGAVVFLDRMDQAEKVRRLEGRNKLTLRQMTTRRDSLQAQVSTLSKKAHALERAFEPAQKASEVIGEVTALAPKSIWLTGITFERGKQVLLRGTAMQSGDVATYLESLSNQDRFREVKLAFANDSQIEDTPVSQFSISLHAIGNLPLADPKSARRAATQ